MIKLQIVRQKRAEFPEIAVVVSIEKLRIQRLDCLKQYLRCSSGLCVDARRRCSNQSGKKQGFAEQQSAFSCRNPFSRVYALGSTYESIRLFAPGWRNIAVYSPIRCALSSLVSPPLTTAQLTRQAGFMSREMRAILNLLSNLLLFSTLTLAQAGLINAK